MHCYISLIYEKITILNSKLKCLFSSILYILAFVKSFPRLNARVRIYRPCSEPYSAALRMAVIAQENSGIMMFSGNRLIVKV